MADQTRKPKPREDEQVEAAEETSAEAQTDEVDDLLDEIDEVLEANAEEFVRSYVQKGGE
jgi:ubiquitin-like protein Pup